MKLYMAIDLHSTNNYVAAVSEDGKPIMNKRLRNNPGIILETLAPYKDEVARLAVESTYNWYWLVDLLMSEGYRVHLANPTAIRKYSGLKYADDRHDARWLAELLRLGVLPEGYIYPKEQRPLRDLLRKRQQLVRLRTSMMLSLQNLVTRHHGVKLGGSVLKRLGNPLEGYLEAHDDLKLAGTVSKQVIDYLTERIAALESHILKQVKEHEAYRHLMTIPGVGKILAMTIVLETGPVSRFAKVGRYASYCRKVQSLWLSNEKAKGKGNEKSGNKYLAWAFSEAAEIARRYDPACQAFYERKRRQSNRMVAHNALAHKLARAAYHVLRDNVAFEATKLFCEKPGRNGKPESVAGDPSRLIG
jgi:transposase